MLDVLAGLGLGCRSPLRRRRCGIVGHGWFGIGQADAIKGRLRHGPWGVMKKEVLAKSLGCLDCREANRSKSPISATMIAAMTDSIPGMP